MAYYAALVSTVQLLEEMSHSERQYSNSLFKTFSHLQELLDDYSPNDKEAAGLLDRIRDAACQAQDLMESNIPDSACRARKIIESYIPDSACGEQEIVECQPPTAQDVVDSRIPNAAYRVEHYDFFDIPDAFYIAESIIESAISDRIRERNCLEEIVHTAFWHFVSACHNSEHVVNEEVVFTVRQGYGDLLKLTKQLGFVVGKGCRDLRTLVKEVDSINMGKGYLDLVKLKEELDFLVLKEYQDLLKLKEELDAIVGDQDLERVKEVVDSIVGRGNQGLDRVTEEVDSIVDKGYKGLFDKVKEEVDSIVKDLKRITEKSQTTHQDDLQGGAGVSTHEPTKGTTMVGFEQHLATLKAQLFGDSSRLEIISIVGMGGIGKTTLARNIFDDKLINNHFDFRVWVTVSQSYHFPNILRAILDSLNINEEELHGIAEEVLKQRIYKRLFGKRYLIMMDDVWDMKIWDDLKWVFPNDQSRSRIIITTRQSDVASLASASEFHNKIPVLEFDQSWDLFLEKVDCPLELIDIGKSIVKNCGGLPLAIVVVAGLLSKVNKTEYDWKVVAKGISSAAKNDEHFSKILSLSFNYLPHHLKPCFLYFGGFPEDYEISVSRLVKLWVAEGFLKPVASKSLEEVAEEYLEELVERNLVLITKRRSNGKFRQCSIHDLLRDLCLERARHEHFLLLLHKHSATGHIHRFFIHSNSSSNIPMPENDFLHVRSFLSFGDTPSQVSSHRSNFKPMRVLDAPYIDFTFSPDGVFELPHLRYLVFLHGISRFISPSLFKLQNLQTLIVVSWDGKTILFPSEIWMMPQLRHIMIDRVKLPHFHDGLRFNRDGVPWLGRLQTLSKVEDFIFDCSTVDIIPNLKKLKLVSTRNYYENEVINGLKTLVNLRQLETLDIYFSNGFSPLPSNFSFPMSLTKLTLRGCHRPWRDLTIAGSLPNLQVLKLRWESFVGREWEPIEGEFPKLKYLLLERLYDLEYWGAENSHFPCLEQLHIKNCPKLEIPSEVGEIPNLQLIELHYCGSFVESRAEEIQQEQEEVGNSSLQVRCIRQKVC